MQLRYLQTVTEIGGQQSSTTMFPLAVDLIGPLLDRAGVAPAAP
jgi:hypothetical protein